MNQDEKVAEAVRYFWQLAQESIASAHREIHEDALHTVTNRIYYAAFYAVSALLLERGLSFKKHTGVRAALHKNFIQTGEIDREWGRFYERIFEKRNEGDYLPFVFLNREETKIDLHACSEFLEVIRGLLKSVNGE
jgi:uncharacterized protein